MVNSIAIISDSREQKNSHILNYFESVNQPYVVSKLYCGDYTRIDSMSICVEKKKDLQEICGNVTTQHKRFKAELMRAQEHKIKLVVLCEHSPDIKTLEDVRTWENPRIKKSPNATTGEQLFKTLSTMSARYNVDFLFCKKSDTGKRIIELLGVQNE